MSDYIRSGAIKVIEIVGVSEDSFDDAVHQAVSKASQSVKGITGLEVHKYMTRIENGKIKQYRANVKIAFPVK